MDNTENKSSTEPSTSSDSNAKQTLISSRRVAVTSSNDDHSAIPSQLRIVQNFRLIWLDSNIDETNANFKFYKQPRPVSTLLKGLIRWLVHIHHNPKAITKTEYSTLILNKRESVLRCMTAN